MYLNSIFEFQLELLTIFNIDFFSETIMNCTNTYCIWLFSYCENLTYTVLYKKVKPAVMPYS